MTISHHCKSCFQLKTNTIWNLFLTSCFYLLQQMQEDFVKWMSTMPRTKSVLQIWRIGAAYAETTWALLLQVMCKAPEGRVLHFNELLFCSHTLYSFSESFALCTDILIRAEVVQSERPGPTSNARGPGWYLASWASAL